MARGDEAALDSLYSRFGQLAYGLAYEMVRDEDAAQAIVVEAFGHIWRSASGSGPDRDPRGQLLHEVHRRAVQLVRASDGRPARPAQDRTQPRWVSAKGQLARELLDQLPAEDREALELAYYNAYTREELAPILGVSVEVVTTRIANGLRRLRDLQLPATA